MGKAIAGVVNFLLILVVVGLAGVLVWQGVQLIQRHTADPLGDAPKTLCQAASRRIEGDMANGGHYAARLTGPMAAFTHSTPACLPSARPKQPPI